MAPIKRLFPLIARLIAWPVLAVLICLEPIIRVRITHLWTARIGHLALNTLIYAAARRRLGPEKRTFRIFFGANPCNRQLFNMWKRVLPVIESRVLSAIYHYAGQRVQKSRVFAPLDCNAGLHKNIALCNGVLSFTEEEERLGHELLQRMGLGPDDWFVCFTSRDPSFHEARVGHDDKDHRNCTVESYLDAARLVTERGGFAIRMGAMVDSPLPDIGNPRIIDYASKFRSDFGDIYLLGKCLFLLGSPTGTISIPSLFGRPVAMANNLPYMAMPGNPISLLVPKLIREPTGELMTFAELHRQGMFNCNPGANKEPWVWDQSEFYARTGRWPVDNTDEEILDLCRDMFDRLDGRAPDPEAARLQRLYKERFWAEVPEVVEYGPDIGPSFALKYRHLIEAS
ncbi:hypothetical protein H261_07928 [Paramagnetospirillum caucaseum]|uniref:TIGR04372 family glycosyltransferase n=1 Tax=Paramagnetospirillum caucaseum TaxID=1244869 RepID=M2ZT57_9PROT|nr:TIGR04372 family glycosyltransferase [Paramagnetospirillum caucaseum]EME70542.1 hypothetical protein H261_07928 [Paramagnetospirillum caucaseum]